MLHHSLQSQGKHKKVKSIFLCELVNEKTFVLTLFVKSSKNPQIVTNSVEAAPALFAINGLITHAERPSEAAERLHTGVIVKEHRQRCKHQACKHKTPTN